MTALQRILEEQFGFDTFLPGQEEVVGHLMDGHSAAAVFPTGGGKSLCYQLPALELSVRSNNCLASANITTLGELLSWDQSSLLKLRSFGKTSLRVRRY